MDFTGKAILVTGAAHGIGRAIALRLLSEGASVAAVDNDGPALTAMAHDLADMERLDCIEADVAAEADVEKAVAKAVEAFGRLDGLVNNAAIAANGPLELLALENWRHVLAVNLTGPFLMARAAAPHLRPAKGAIVNIASTRAVMSEAGTEAYSASKGGVVALTHALAASLAPQVRVNCISPGWVHTKGPEPSARDHAQHWAGRVGRPDDIANLAAWLLSDEAGFVTGANMTSDGGMTRKMIYEE